MSERTSREHAVEHLNAFGSQQRMLRPSSRRPAAALLMLALGLGSPQALADDTDTTAPGSEPAAGAPAATPESGTGPSQAACLEAHGKAQEFKRNTKFIEAAEQLLICSSATCPGIVIADCGDWIGELDRRTPSLAFSIKQDGSEATGALVKLDGTPVSDLSQVVKVNPGRHVVSIELSPFSPREEVVFARDGAGTQVVSVEFVSEAPKAPAPTEPAPDTTSAPERYERPVPTLFYPLIGLSAAGFASFGVFAYIGSTRQQELEDNCEPGCTDAELKPMKNSYLIADISLAVGAASLLGAAVTYFTRPTKVVPAEAAFSIQVEPSVTADSTEIGISAVQTW